MNDLPSGWKIVRLEEVADTALGRMLDRSKSKGHPAVPYLRNVNVQWGRIDTDDLLTMEIPPEQVERFTVRQGDLLVCEGGEIGRAAIWNRPDTIAYQKALHRVRSKGPLVLAYLRYLLEFYSNSGLLARFATGSTIAHLPQEQLRALPVPLPPVEEQRRIVEMLEDHLSRLDAGVRLLNSSSRRLRTLIKSVLVRLAPAPLPPGWVMTTVGEAGSIDLGRQRHPDWHTGPEMRPYLRVANVFEDRIDLSDLKEMDFSGVFERYRLSPGDVLLNEGQSPELLGRPAIYRGDPPDVAFTNTLLRFRANPDVLPEWALLVFRMHMHSGRFVKEARITTNIAHLSARRLKSVEFPKPPFEEQRRLVDETARRLEGISRLDGEIAKALSRAAALRQALIRGAFEGRLTERTNEVVEELADG